MKTTLEKVSKTILDAERELQELDGTIDRVAAETAAATRRINADRIAGAVDDREAGRLEAAVRELERMQARRQVLQSALPELLTRREAAEEEARSHQVEKKRDELRRAVANRERALRQFAARTREHNASAAEVGRHRELVDACVAGLTPLLADTEDVGVTVDEVEWPETVSELSQFLAAGPRQPEAEQEREREQAAAGVARQTAEVLAWFAQHPSQMRLAQLPEHLRGQAEEILQEHQAQNETEQRRLREQAKSREAVRL
ncbi:MAG: hypothetical protein WKF65_07715 [Gaiellaceae bacterium]